jgi:hypothetical protein
MVDLPLKLLQITFEILRARASVHDLTKVGRLRYLPSSTASIITSNDNTAP